MSLEVLIESLKNAKYIIKVTETRPGFCSSLSLQSDTAILEVFFCFDIPFFYLSWRRRDSLWDLFLHLIKSSRNINMIQEL